MQRDTSAERRQHLGRLADRAMDLLLESDLGRDLASEPADETEAIVQALRAMAQGVVRFEGMKFGDYPAENRQKALMLLEAPVLQGNPQAVRLRYILHALASPGDVRGQLALLEQLQDEGIAFTPQMRLELAILLHQAGRHHEAGRMFRRLRQIWREAEHFVEVPSRLRWLMTPDGAARHLVNARIVAGPDQRPIAKVAELRNESVPFRPTEFNVESTSIGALVRGYISFGHNGPFLRPATAAAG